MKCAPLAQLVEHLTLNQGVRGSSPRRRISLETSVSGLFLFSESKSFIKFLENMQKGIWLCYNVHTFDDERNVLCLVMLKREDQN